MQSTLPAAVAAIAAIAAVAIAAVAIAVAAVAITTVPIAAVAKAAAAPVRLIIISGPAVSRARARAASTPLGLALRPVQILEIAQGHATSAGWQSRRGQLAPPACPLSCSRAGYLLVLCCMRRVSPAVLGSMPSPFQRATRWGWRP